MIRDIKLTDFNVNSSHFPIVCNEASFFEAMHAMLSGKIAAQCS